MIGFESPIAARSFLGFPDPTTPFIPIFLVLLLLEAVVAARLVRAGRQIRGFEARDTRASLLTGLVSIGTVGLIELCVWALAHALWRFRVADLGSGPLGIVAALLAWDFAYYWLHRLEHRSRFFWAAHVNHHSSEHYNLSTALRQPITPFGDLLFFAPLALLGISPQLIFVAWGWNLVYQFWIHTELVPRLGPLEWVLNTPSHHRVHHGSNQQYLDRNYGGILIVWDRLFGTFEREDAPVVYGLTKNIRTFNLWRIATHEYAAIRGDLQSARGWRERLGYVFGPPGWRPERTATLAAAATVGAEA